MIQMKVDDRRSHFQSNQPYVCPYLILHGFWNYCHFWNHEKNQYSYADDTQIYLSFDHLHYHEAADSINKDLEKLERFSEYHNL